jgi:hypothetical protein
MKVRVVALTCSEERRIPEYSSNVKKSVPFSRLSFNVNVSGDRTEELILEPYPGDLRIKAGAAANCQKLFALKT